MKRCLAILTSCMAFLPIAFGADATRMKVLTYNIAGGKNAFSIGTSGTAVSHVVFMGDGSFKSLFGKFVKKIKGFYLHFR